MFKKYSVRLAMVISLAVSIILASYPVNAVNAPAGLFSDIEGKMNGISEKEKETLQKLFDQTQLISETEKKVSETADDIKKSQSQVADLKKTIAADEASWEKDRGSLKQVLQTYQKMGPGSYLEILLKSESLPDLLMRINTLRDLTRNTGELMDKITADKEKQQQEEAKLSDELLAVQALQKKQEQTLAVEQKLKDALETYLSSLAEEKGHYQESLNSLQKAWDGLAPFIRDTIRELTVHFAEAGLPDNAFEINFSLVSPSISINDKGINEFLGGDPDLGGMTFAFHQDRVDMGFPDEKFMVSGKFVIADGQRLRFEPEEASFYGIFLDAGTIAGIFKDNNLEINAGSVLMGLKLKSVDIEEGSMTLKL